MKNRKSRIIRLLVFAILLSFAVFTGTSNAEITAYTQGENFPGSGVSAFGSFGDSLYVGTLTKGIFRFNERSRTFDDFYRDTFAGKEVNAIAEYRGKLYIGTKQGLFVYDGETIEKKDKAGKVFLENVKLVVDTLRDVLIVEAMHVSGGLLSYDGNEWRFLGGEGKGLFNDITAFAVAEEGVYLGSIGGALYLYDGSIIELAVEQFFPSSLLALAKSGDSLYVGTGRGLYRVSGGKMMRVHLEGMGDSPVFSLAAKGDVVYAATPKGIYRMQGGRAEFIGKEGGIKGGKVKKLFLRDGRLFAGTLGGFLVIRGW